VKTRVPAPCSAIRTLCALVLGENVYAAFLSKGALLKIRLLFAAALGAAVFVAAAGAATNAGQLVGTVGPGFSIKVTMNGKAVKSLKAGTYKLVVHDRADSHNFHVFGPGLNKKVTTVSFMGTKTVTVTLKKGKYTFQCDPHAAAGMKGSFTVS